MTRLMTRLLIVPIGVGFAALAAMVVGLAGSIAWGFTRDFAEILTATGLSVAAAAIGGADPNDVAAFLSFIWLVLAGTLVVPIVVVALIGEASRIGAWMFYAFGMGATFASVPVLFPGDPARHGWPDKAGLGFLATGIAAGTAYWLVAGRGAASGAGQPRGFQGETAPREGQPDAGRRAGGGLG
jgi:hypothetical protein